MRVGTILVSIGIATFVSFVPCVYAQEVVTAGDEAQLTSLYRSLLKYPTDAYIQRRIVDERARIHTAIEKELRKSSLQSTGTDDAPIEGQELLSAIEQQRIVVSGLEERLKERKVNIDLLKAEEERYYSEGALPMDDASDALRIAKNHEELLAKVAIDEERIAVLEAVLSLENERLNKLTRDQWISQFGDIIRILSYIGFIVGIIFIERIVRSIIVRRIPEAERRYVVTKVFTAITYTVLTVWILTTIVSENPGILTSLAIVGAGLAVALQDVVKDAVGWIMILQKRLFTLGDRISVGPFTGDVVDITLLRTTLLEVHSSSTAAVQERTGRTLYMPNAAVLTHDTVNFNHTSDYIKAEMGLTLTYESNWKKAGRILEEILDEVTGKYFAAARRQYDVRTRTLFVRQESSTPQVYMDLAGDGIAVTLRFTIPIGMRREVISEITKLILMRFAPERDIGIAYRTSMVYNAENPPPSFFDPRTV